jgi:hypothetical protein
MFSIDYSLTSRLTYSDILDEYLSILQDFLLHLAMKKNLYFGIVVEFCRRWTSKYLRRMFDKL